MLKLDLKQAGPSGFMYALRAMASVALLAVAVPAGAFHFPWDQGHDTTSSNDPNKPGPDDRSTCDECNGKSTQSPVYAALGHAIWSSNDVVLRGRPYIGVYRAYNSNDPVVGLFGNGWSVDFDIALYPATNSGTQQRIFKAANGKRFIFAKQTNGSFTAPAARFETVVEGPASVTMTMLDGRRDVFALDGRLLQRIDTNGNVVSYSYDGSLRPVGISDGNGRTLAIAYNSASLVASVTDNSGRVWRYAYDTNASLTSVTDPLGGVMRYTWQAYRPSGDANTYYQLLSATDASGVVQVSLTYSGNQVASYTEGANRYTYTRTTSNTSLAGTVTERDALNVATSFTYGALGLVTQTTDGVGGRTSYTYDTNGRITTTVDALNRSWTSSYDSLGRLTASSNPLTQSGSVQYAGNDPRPVRMTSPSGRVVTMAYDGRGNLTSTVDPAGAATTIAYNSRGDVVNIRNALTQQTSIVYTATGLATQMSDPLGRTSTMAYDALGRVSTATNAAGETTRYVYDVLDRVTSVTDPLNQVTAFSYDAAGRLTSVTDAKGSVTQYQYDAFGRRSAEIAPDGRKSSYTFRTDNLLSQITWPDNTTIVYTYDNNKRVTRETAGTEVINYTYNAVNQVLSASGPGGTVSYTYDNAGRVATETSGGKTNVITRNAEGERTKLDYLAQSQTYARDARGLVTRIAAPAGDFGFSFDALGRRTQLAYPNGSTASYAFDAAGQLTNLTHSGVFNAPYAHTFDAAGRITRITGDGPDWNYRYDALGRLTRATQDASAVRGRQASQTQAASVFTYAMDPVGNILDGGRTYDVNHRLTADAAKNYSYDERGNLTLEQDKATNARTVYTWNTKNQLRQVQLFANATAGSLTRTLAFTYDPLGRRASKADGGVTQKFVYDGDNLIGTLDAANNTTVANVFSGAIDEPLATTTGGTPKTLHANHLGSVKAVVDGSTLTSTYGYSPYGEPLTGSSADSTAFRYTGREKDTDSLYYYRSRYYDTKQSRFISSDQVGLSGGVNTYAYVGGNPNSLRDPSGYWAGIDDLVFSGGGALVGIVGQGVSDLFSGQVSGWEDYAGSALGGAAFGETLLYAGPIAAGVVGGAVTNASKQGLKNLTGKQCGFNWTSFGVDTAVGGATGLIPGSWMPRIAGLNAGRGSMVAVSKQMITKFENGTISNVSAGTAAKMFAGRSLDTAVPYGVAGGAAGGVLGNNFIPGYSDSCGCP